MKIQEINSLLSAFTQTRKNSNLGDFSKELSLVSKIQDHKMTNEIGVSTAKFDVDKFKDELVKYGSYAFLNTLNAEKINEKIEQKREELKEILGLNDAKNINDEKISQLNQILEDMLNDYKKELNDRVKNNAILEKAQNLNSKNNISKLNLSDLINLV